MVRESEWAVSWWNWGSIDGAKRKCVARALSTTTARIAMTKKWRNYETAFTILMTFEDFASSLMVFFLCSRISFSFFPSFARVFYTSSSSFYVFRSHLSIFFNFYFGNSFTARSTLDHRRWYGRHRHNLHVVYVLGHYSLVASFLDPVCFFFFHFMLPLKANDVECERKVCLCNESSVWHGSRRRPRNAHFILKEPLLCNRVNGGAGMTERSSFCRAAIITIIITNDTVNRFPLYIACNNEILLFASNLPFSIFVLHTHISHYPSHEHARTHCGQCSRYIGLWSCWLRRKKRRQRRTFSHAVLFFSLFDTRRFLSSLLFCCVSVVLLFSSHSTLLREIALAPNQYVPRFVARKWTVRVWVSGKWKSARSFDAWRKTITLGMSLSVCAVKIYLYGIYGGPQRYLFRLSIDLHGKSANK